MIIDASAVLSAFFPDEHQDRAQALIRDHVSGVIRLVGPTLLLYEVTNAVLQAVRRERITHQQGEEILTTFEGLGVALELVRWPQMLALARRLGCTAYDAAYLALAEAREEPLVTADLRLYRAAHDHLAWVRWVGDM